MHYQELSSAKYLQKDASMSAATLQPIPAAKKSGGINHIQLLTLTGVFIPMVVAWFYILPFVQAPLLPEAPGRAEGPWLIPPDQSGRFFGCISLAAIMTYLLTIPLHQKWKADNLAAGRRRFADAPQIVKRHIYSVIVAFPLISAALLARYFCSWCLISADGIQVQMPHAQTNYSFAQVTTLRLEPLPIATESERYGYDIHFDDGRHWSFTSRHRGLTEIEVTAITNFLSEHTGQEWRIIPYKRRR